MSKLDWWGNIKESRLLRMASENELIANELIEYNSDNKKVIDDYKKKQS